MKFYSRALALVAAALSIALFLTALASAADAPSADDGEDQLIEEARTALSRGDGQRAETLSNQILRVDEGNFMGYFLRGLARLRRSPGAQAQPSPVDAIGGASEDLLRAARLAPAGQKGLVYKQLRELNPSWTERMSATLQLDACIARVDQRLVAASEFALEAWLLDPTSRRSEPRIAIHDALTAGAYEHVARICAVLRAAGGEDERSLASLTTSEHHAELVASARVYAERAEELLADGEFEGSARAATEAAMLFDSGRDQQRCYQVASTSFAHLRRLRESLGSVVHLSADLAEETLLGPAFSEHWTSASFVRRVAGTLGDSRTAIVRIAAAEAMAGLRSSAISRLQGQWTRSASDSAGSAMIVVTGSSVNASSRVGMVSRTTYNIGIDVARAKFQGQANEVLCIRIGRNFALASTVHLLRSGSPLRLHEAVDDDESASGSPTLRRSATVWTREP